VRALIVPPMEDGRCAINGPDKWDQGRRRGVKSGEDGAARHAIIRRAAIEGDDRCPGVKINCSTVQPSQSIDPRAGLERELVGRVATSKVAANLRAKIRDVNRRNESPVAIPRAPPPGLAKAVSRD
jgi:hypothetical protein